MAGEIDLLLIGHELPANQIAVVNKRLKNYGLEHTKLSIRQGLNAKQEIDFSQIKASILEDVFKKDSSAQALNPRAAEQNAGYANITDELKALYPDLRYYAVSDMAIHRADTLPLDTITTVIVNFTGPLKVADRRRLNEWLKNRLKVDTVKLLVD